MSYFNGENNRLNFPLQPDVVQTPQPIPRLMSFAYLVTGEKALDVFAITFNDDEMQDAFEKLGSNGEQLYLEFSPTLPKPATKIRVYNNKESITLIKWAME